MTQHPDLPDPDVASLSFEELRAYRHRLRDEDDRVSYWRRLVHARVDLVQAGRDASGTLSLDEVVRALGDTASGRRREALHRVRAHEPLPDLPVLADVWHDQAPVEGLLAAADQLSSYRAALHARIDEATGELIERYRQSPTLALKVMAP